MKQIKIEYNNFIEKVFDKLSPDIKNIIKNNQNAEITTEEIMKKDMKIHYQHLTEHLNQFKHKQNNKNLEFNYFNTKFYGEDENIAQKIKKGCIRFCEKNEEVIEKINGLIFFSEIRGSGKTLMAKILCNYFLDNYKMAKFTTGYNIISEIMADKENMKDIIYKYQNYSFLVIDELNMIKFTEFKEGIIFDIIEARKQNKKPTIITTNILPEDMEIGESIKNRLKNYFYTFEFPEISIRDFSNIAEREELENILFD